MKMCESAQGFLLPMKLKNRYERTRNGLNKLKAFSPPLISLLL